MVQSTTAPFATSACTTSYAPPHAGLVRRAVRFTVLVSALAGFTLSGCECKPVVGRIAPQIYLDACKTPDRKINGESVGGYADCEVDFGTVDISVKERREITVNNPSTLTLNLESVKIVGDPAFKLELAPDQILERLSGTIVVSVRPNVEAPIEATLFILSDANNTEQTPDKKSLIEVHLKASGIDHGMPDIEVTPPNCNFEKVGVGGTQTCMLSIKNTGNRELVVDAVEFIPVGADPAVQFAVPERSTLVPFSIAGRAPAGEPVAIDSSIELGVRFTPDVLGSYSGRLHILSNDPDVDEQEIIVGLDGEGVTPPSCALRVKSVNGVEVPIGEVASIEPLDDVIVTADQSVSSSGEDGGITATEWHLKPDDRPVGSQVALSAPNAVETGFLFADTVGVDLVGRYTLGATVTDELGVESVNECTLTFEAIPKDHFLVQLSWDTPENDLDLHVTKQDSSNRYCIWDTSGETPTGVLTSECQSLDCNWTTCKAEGNIAPDWDADLANRSAGDPSLDIDDIDGFGPENTNVDVMVPGNYLIGINEYSATSEYEAGATVRIYIYGRLAAEFVDVLEVGQWWEVAKVIWPDPESDLQPCVEDLTDGDATDDCGT